MKLKFISTLVLSQGLCAGTLFANPDLERADQLFKQREGHNFSQLTETRNLYKSIFDNSGTTADERLKVMTQIGRLDIYRGGLLPELQFVSKEQRVEAMDACLNDLMLIEDTNSSQFHYFRISCLGFRGKLEDGVLGRMKYGLQMRKAQGPALEVAQADKNGFEGGGIYRVMSALRGNRKAKPLGLYNADEAMTYASQAILVPPGSDLYFEEDYSGADYYENYYYQAQGMVANGIELESFDMVQDARGLLKSKIRKISVLAGREGGLKERRPETLAYQQIMKNLLGKVDECAPKDNWKSCLIDALDR